MTGAPNIFDDPFKELALQVLIRAIKDSKGLDMCTPRNEKFYKKHQKIVEAKRWLNTEVCELFFDGLNISRSVIEKRMNNAK